ncbi:hypothetical protein NEMBOFW57_007603 [Staphylotrichum longicolle]|uniref:Nucleoporin SEH1 n=1 Tax=Staphylotrichum longicolle TaxID=669026 RepID=A0AAD4EVE6_9PEZI|nr:hypothetical protein NEMBOFW57_007603 [Staphylotrichum longicolle]
MSRAAAFLADPPATDDRPSFETIIKHGHQDLVQAVAFNGHGDRCATGSVDGKIRVFNRHKDGQWRLCDTWGAHASEILELQWLPTTIYPNLLASLGIEGRFKLWAEDPAAAPGRRFAEQHHQPLLCLGLCLGLGHTTNAKPAFETRNARSPYRSFSLKHLDDSRTTYLALLSADGGLTVYENDRVENLAAFTLLDELPTTRQRREPAARPRRGDQLPRALRPQPGGVLHGAAVRRPSDALGLVVAVMDSVRVYRTRDTIRASLGVAAAWKGFYLAAEVAGGCTAAWCGTWRGRRGTCGEEEGGGEEGAAAAAAPAWGAGRVKKHGARRKGGEGGGETVARASLMASSGIRAGLDQSAGNLERRTTGLPGQIRHVVTEISRLDSHRTPVWRVGFDDDGQILGSVGDEGKLMCYRQKPDGAWAKSTEMAMVKMKMATP